MKTLIFDTETTGFLRNKMVPLIDQPKIIEYFGVSLDEEMNEVSTRHELFNPQEKLSPRINQITGITDDDLKDSEAFTLERAIAMKEYIESHDEVVAHNLSFDMGMFNVEMQRHDLEIKWPEKICTVESTNHIKGFRLSLSKLYEELFDDAFDGAHRAEADVRALARCFKKLREDKLV